MPDTTRSLRVLTRRRYLWWRLAGYRIARFLDARWEAKHLREYGWPLSLGMGPFSRPESRWHECPGHEWERIDWPYGRASKRGYPADRITRCRACGAPRCGTGEDRPMQSCTLERHHTEAHDYLDGTQVEVGA